MIIGFGNWIKPGSPAVTVLFADAYDGRMNAPADENVALPDRPGISDEPEWLDMVQQAINGTWTDWTAWNEKYLDVAWSNALFRQLGGWLPPQPVGIQRRHRRERLPVRSGYALRDLGAIPRTEDQDDPALACGVVSIPSVPSNPVAPDDAACSLT